MSDLNNNTSSAIPVADTSATAPTTAEPMATSTEPTTSTAEPATSTMPTTTATADSSKPEPIATDATTTQAPVTEGKADSISPVGGETVPAVATEDKKDDVASPAEKIVEPISHGQLGYKGPGLLKSLIPSKKEFWLSDDAVSPQNMNSFMRGEKPEVANPIVAYASQTGKGLLFFNKKGMTSHKSPESVLALYEATDLNKQPTHEIAFRLHGQEHSLKASSDAERDGWYMAIEKAMELGKANKEDVRESEGYKSEMEKLNKPNMPAAPVAAAASKPKKSHEADKTADRKASSSDEEAVKKNKSRSTSRGLVDRFRGKKEEHDIKKDEKKAEKEEVHDDKEHDHTDATTAAGVAGAGAAGVGGAAAVSSHDHSAESNKAVDSVDKPLETSTEKPLDKPTEKFDDKPKQNKRGSIFGRISGFGGVKSPSKEKDQHDAELKPQVPPKDDSAPQIPAPATETPAIQPAITAVEPPSTTDIKTDELKAEGEKKDGVATPSKEKPKFLSGLSFMKRDRSVSPSATKKDEPLKTESEAPKTETPVAEPLRTEEPIAAPTTTPATAPEPAPVTALPETSDKPTEKVDETPKETETSTPNKRQSVFGNLGRRASKAFRGMQSSGPKKENTTPKAEAKDEPITDATPSADKPVTESKPEGVKNDEPTNNSTIGDVVPDAITAGQPQQSQTTPTVASAA